MQWKYEKYRITDCLDIKTCLENVHDCPSECYLRRVIYITTAKHITKWWYVYDMTTSHIFSHQIWCWNSDVILTYRRLSKTRLAIRDWAVGWGRIPIKIAPIWDFCSCGCRDVGIFAKTSLEVCLTFHWHPQKLLYRVDGKCRTDECIATPLCGVRHFLVRFLYSMFKLNERLFTTQSHLWYQVKIQSFFLCSHQRSSRGSVVMAKDLHPVNPSSTPAGWYTSRWW